MRDFVGLFLIHLHIMPLWAAIWAAPGKDESWSPVSLADRIAMKNSFRQADIEDGILSTISLSASEIGATIRAAIEEAQAVFQSLPDDLAGRLSVDSAGGLVTNPAEVASRAHHVQAIQAARGGARPSGEDIDHALIAHIIESYGWEGRNPRSGHDPGASAVPES